MTEILALRPGLVLEREAAHSWARMEHVAGRQLDVNRSTVDRDTQMRLFNDYASGRSHTLALHPDKSWHCLPRARAVDTDDDAWVRAHPEHGWRFVVLSEKWHAQYYPEYDNYRGQGIPAGTEDDVSAQDVTMGLYNTRVQEDDGASRNLFDQNARPRGEVRAQFATMRAMLTEIGKGGITPEGLDRIQQAAFAGAEQAVEARYRAQIDALKAQIAVLEGGTT